MASYKLKKTNAAGLMASSPLMNKKDGGSASGTSGSGGYAKRKHDRQISNMQQAWNDKSKNVFDRAGNTLIKTENPMGIMVGYGIKNHPVNLTYKAGKAIGSLFKMKPPVRSEYDSQHAYDQAMVKYDRARNHNPDEVKYNPNDPSTYSEAKLTSAHVRPNVKGAVGQMSPYNVGPEGPFDSKGRRISLLEDDPTYDASGQRKLVTVTGDESTKPKKKSTKTQTKPKANTTSGYTGVGRPTQSGNTKPEGKDDSKKTTTPVVKNTKKTTTTSTSGKTKPVKTHTPDPNNTVLTNVIKNTELGQFSTNFSKKSGELVSKATETVNRALSGDYDLISSRPKSTGRVGRVARRQKAKTDRLYNRLERRANRPIEREQIQKIRENERGKRSSMRESASQERTNLLKDDPIPKDASGGRKSSQPSEKQKLRQAKRATRKGEYAENAARDAGISLDSTEGSTYSKLLGSRAYQKNRAKQEGTTVRKSKKNFVKGYNESQEAANNPGRLKMSVTGKMKETTAKEPKIKGKTKRQLKRSDKFSASLSGAKNKNLKSSGSQDFGKKKTQGFDYSKGKKGQRGHEAQKYGI